MTSFRPRPIDIDKPLLIVRKELTDEEARPMPALSTGMETHEENVRFFVILLTVFYTLSYISCVFMIILGITYS